MRPRAAAPAAWLALLLLATCLGAAHAQLSPRLLLLDRGSPALARKLRAEAEYAGLVLQAAAEPPAREPDAAWLEQSGAAALVSVSSSQRVQLLVLNPRTHSPEVLQLQSGADDESFALRSIEQLRARLVDLGWALPGAAAHQDVPSIAPRAPNPSASADVSDRAHASAARLPHAGWRWWLNGGVGALDASGGIGVSLHGLLGVQLEWADAWSLGASALLPFYDKEVHGSEGEADVDVDVFLLQLGYSQRWAQRWRWSAALGPGLLVLPVRAEARAPWQGKTDRLVSGLGSLELGLAHELGGWLRVRAGVLAGFCAPRPVVSFAGRDAASWGRWFGGFALRAELAVPPSAEPFE